MVDSFSMGRIRVLSDETVNQIAAGEVVENVASVVKELIDNSLDAGAQEIGVELVGGGRQLIRVSDDGCGMDRGDALLAFERHATSKIREAGDLIGVPTRGFRGEAIPSIASVSRVVLLTSQEPPEGVRVENGVAEPASRSQGTTLEVHSLFHNVPVRREFQRAIAQDVSEVKRTMMVLALAHPEVRFQLLHDGKVLLDLRPGERVRDVLGAEVYDAMLPIESEGIRGWIGTAAQSRPNRLGQYLYVNGRAVLSRTLSDALSDGYGQRIAEGRHPIAVLFLDVPGELVDLNVHPQKLQVRLREEAALQSRIAEAIRMALDCRASVPKVIRPPQPAAAPAPLELPPMPEPAQFQPLPIPVMILALFSRYALVELSTLPARIRDELPRESGLCVVDLRAALSRVLYEQMEGEPASQLLLVPETLHLLPEESSRLEQNLELLTQLGYGIRSLGGHSYVVDALPTDVEEPLELLRQLEGRLTREGASHLASRRRGPFQREEAAALLQRLFHGPSPLESPRGERTLALLSERELARILK